MSIRPRVRTEEIIAERLDRAVVLYDSATKQAHALDETATRVWSLADGSRTMAQIAKQAGLDDAAAIAGLDQLQARQLLLESDGVSRRWIFEKVRSDRRSSSSRGAID